MGNSLRKLEETDATEQEQQQKEATEFTCEICIEPTLSNRKFQNGSLCVHPFCLDCIAKYVEMKVEGIVGKIKCPGLNCKYPLDPLSCKPVIAKPTFDKWCDLLCDSAVFGSDACFCPYQDCSAFVLNECRDKLTKTKCPNCKKTFCFQCKLPWHTGYRCSESGQLRERNDILVGQLIEEKKWTRCYKCGHAVERVSGCRNIKCKCGTNFCHECGRRSHLGSCREKSLSFGWRELLVCFFAAFSFAMFICFQIFMNNA